MGEEGVDRCQVLGLQQQEVEYPHSHWPPFPVEKPKSPFFRVRRARKNGLLGFRARNEYNYKKLLTGGYPLRYPGNLMKLNFVTRSTLSRLSLLGLSALAIASCRTNSSENSIVAPSPETTTDASSTTAVATQPVRCETANHYADVTWQGEQPVLTFARKPAEVNVNQTPANRKANPDGSTTFGVAEESTFYVRVFPDGSCFLQVLGSNGAVALEENGRVQ